MTVVEWKPAGDEWGKVYAPTPDVRTWQAQLAEGKSTLRPQVMLAEVMAQVGDPLVEGSR